MGGIIFCRFATDGDLGEKEMPIQVEGPDGQLYEFPDGTSREVMQSAMRKRYGGPSAPATAAPQIKRVQFPDGTVRRIEAPAGASDADILAFAQSQFQAQGYGQQANQAAGGTDPREELTALRRMAELEAKAGGDERDGSWTRHQQEGQGSNGNARLDQIAQALRAADAAGNTEDATRLAAAYVQERDGASRPRKLSEVAGKRTQKLSEVTGGYQRVQLPNGEIAEFPNGMADAEIERVLQRDFPDPSQVKWDAPDPSQVQWDDKPDFSNVRGGVQTLQRQKKPVAYNGPTLAPSAYVRGQPEAPSLDAINAANRAKRNAPGFAGRQAAAEASNRKTAFRALPAPVRAAVGMGQRVAQTGRGVGQVVAWGMDQVSPGDRYQQAMASEAQARERDAFLQGDTAATVGGFAGDVAMTMAPAGALSRLAGVRGVVGAGALGAGYAGLQPVVSGESRAQNAGMGAAFGAGGQALGAGVSALGRSAARAVPAELRTMTSRATELGIPVHASQVSQSLPVKVAASAGKYLPFSGYAKAASAQQTGINRAVAKTFGAETDRLTDDVMLDARRRLSTGFEEVYNRNSVPLTQQGVRKLAQVENAAMRRLTRDDAEVLRNQLDDILANADNGVLTGQKYQAVRTALKKAEGPDKLGQAVKELRFALDDMAADAVGPSDAAKLKSLRSQWANFRTVENVLKQNSGAGGDIRLSSLWPQIRKGSTKEMRELARMGQTLLKDPIADSGTAQRTLAYNLLMGGGSIANPALIPMFAKAGLGGATLGRLANSSALARLLARDDRGMAAGKLGSLMEGAYPYVAPALASYQREGAR